MQPINDIPDEIIQQIGLLLDSVDVAHFATATKRFYGLFNDNMFWKSMCVREGFIQADDATVRLYKALFIESSSLRVKFDRSRRYTISDDGHLATKLIDTDFIATLRCDQPLFTGKWQWAMKNVSPKELKRSSYHQPGDVDVGLAIRSRGRDGEPLDFQHLASQKGETDGWMRDNSTGPCLTNDEFRPGTTVHFYLDCEQRTCAFVSDDGCVQRVIVNLPLPVWPAIALRAIGCAVQLLPAKPLTASLRLKIQESPTVTCPPA
eukprot:TRINITY_DN3475_c0_g1_i1.p1 TRINITY_DN3475_c0_g1~~TRINITY_DN3475_c0_g1_i1.p1  ORF type:complete len:263 (+),score=55.70 TRINITY_DN3475_c0_g1_i1:65-853(+)